MPLEIRELVIKVTVEEHARKSGMDQKDLQDLKNQVIKECVEKVMVKLENLSER